MYKNDTVKVYVCWSLVFWFWFLVTMTCWVTQDSCCKNVLSFHLVWLFSHLWDQVKDAWQNTAQVRVCLLQSVTAWGHDVNLVNHSWCIWSTGYVMGVKNLPLFVAITTDPKSARLWKWVTILFLNKFHKMLSHALMGFCELVVTVLHVENSLFYF